ncbi:MAG: hypothetical protein K5657_07440 [Desulfovibrio sp.]|nr:hypothetical protein [Desulfovibrio sp.]
MNVSQHRERAVAIGKAAFPEPFITGLEFNPPVRGPWNIVHMAYSIPEVHLLYICARGCLRGVIMTALEMGALDRFSWIGLSENDLAFGTIDDVTLDRAVEIIQRLDPTPPLVLLYLSCVHKFCQLDAGHLITELSERFPQTRFIECFMMPTMRKSGRTDEERTRAAMFEALEKPDIEEERAVSIIGNDFAIRDDALLIEMLRNGGIHVRSLNAARSYEDYKDLARSKTLLTTHPDACFAGEETAKRLGKRHLHLPVCYSFSGIRTTLSRLADAFSLDMPDFDREEEEARQALAATLRVLGDRPVVLDYTASPRPLGLARLLLESGFNLRVLYLDAIQEAEKEDFTWIAKHHGDILLVSTLAPENRLAALRTENALLENPLAIGQKAAYMAETDFFLNLVGGGGLYDFRGIIRLAGDLLDAHKTPKNRRLILQMKGFGLPTPLHGPEDV